MLNLSKEEARVILFVITVALLGVGINFAVKMNTRIERFMQSDNLVKLDINRATLEDLINSQAVSPNLAQKIITYRTANGLFKDIENLKEVKGIGEKRLEKLKEIFFVE